MVTPSQDMGRPRDHNTEFADTDSRRYAYGFDFRMHDFMLREFDPLLPAGRALEMGCYKGDFTLALAKRYADLTVLEAASELIATARSRVQAAGNAVRFVHCTFEAATLEERFDAVFLMHTLEHLDNPVRVLERVADWLTPTGRLFVVVPNGNAASRQIAVKMGLVSHNTAVTEGEHDHGHRRTYTSDVLERDIRAAGLQVHRTSGILFKPLANFQFDRALEAGIVDDAYLDGCYALGRQYPELCASLFALCGRSR